MDHSARGPTIYLEDSCYFFRSWGQPHLDRTRPDDVRRVGLCCGDAVRLCRRPPGRFIPLHGARVYSVVVPFSTLCPSFCVPFDTGHGRSLTLVQCSVMPYATTWDDFAESARAIFLAHPSRVRCVSLHWTKHLVRQVRFSSVMLPVLFPSVICLTPRGLVLASCPVRLGTLSCDACVLAGAYLLWSYCRRGTAGSTGAKMGRWC